MKQVPERTFVAPAPIQRSVGVVAPGSIARSVGSPTLQSKKYPPTPISSSARRHGSRANTRPSRKGLLRSLFCTRAVATNPGNPLSCRAPTNVPRMEQFPKTLGCFSPTIQRSVGVVRPGSNSRSFVSPTLQRKKYPPTSLSSSARRHGNRANTRPGRKGPLRSLFCTRAVATDPGNPLSCRTPTNVPRMEQLPTLQSVHRTARPPRSLRSGMRRLGGKRREGVC